MASLSTQHFWSSQPYRVDHPLLVSEDKQCHKPADRDLSDGTQSKHNASHHQFKEKQAIHILLVEDEKRIADFILRGLRAEGWTLSYAEDGEQACEVLQQEHFDAIVLDLMLPGMSGKDVCSIMRARQDYTPVLMLSALNQAGDRVNGLRTGADDYLVKPFDFDELIARIQALVRRASANTQQICRTDESTLSLGDISYDTRSLTVTCGGRKLSLTGKERRILQLFLTSPDRIYSRERILNAVWGANEDPMTNIVDVYVGRLRKKLGKSGKALETVRGEGYRFLSEIAETCQKDE